MTKAERIGGFILALAIAVASAHVRADSILENREALASRIVGNSASHNDRDEIEKAMTDAAARPLFKKIRADRNWGPEHPVWTKLLPEFSVAFGRLLENYAPDIEGRLKSALANSLSEGELSEIAATLSDARYVETQALLKQLGFNSASAIRIMGVLTSPALYSQAEKDLLKEQLSRLKEREKELEALKTRLDSMLKSFQTPAFAKYQQLLPEVLSASLRRLEADEAARQQLRSFVVTWQERVRQD